MKDNRKTWKYRGCVIAPQSGAARYFGHPRFVPDTRMPQYYTRWWRIDFPDRTHCFAATKETCMSYIDANAHRCRISA